MILLRSLLYFIFLIVSTFLFSLSILISSRFTSQNKLDQLANSWGSSNLWVLSRLCGLEFKVNGLSKLNTSNCVVMCKHQSTWETISLRCLLPPSQSWVLKQELLKIPFFGAALRLSKPIAIDRSSGRRAVRQVIQQGTNALNDGRWVVIFPEGTRVPPGAKVRYGIGGAMLAEKSGYSIIPIAHNAGIYWGRRGMMKYPGTVHVVIGDPIITRGKKAKDIVGEVENWIESTVDKLPSNVTT